MRVFSILLVLVLLAGCSQPSIDRAVPAEQSLFSATAMRIHPIFTQIRDWTGDGVPDGLEVLIEFQDQFGDPTKAAGTVMFELYEYRPGNAEPRGPRLVNPWVGSIVTVDEQRARWNRTSNTYTFQLAYPSVNVTHSYVLVATFRSSAGTRFFSRAVLAAQEDESATTKPTTKPSSFLP